MASEYSRPMLDVGSPRVFNINVLTRRLLAKDANATPFFRNKPFNRLVLIKDTMPEEIRRTSIAAIGTKLYFPFNEDDVYEGGRTIFVQDKYLEQALKENFGHGAFRNEDLAEDMRVLNILDRLPSLDPFLLKDVFLNQGIAVNEAYFNVDKELWQQIETFILARFEPVVSAAFPDAVASDEKTRILVEKIWEARDLEALDPLIAAFRLPRNEALTIFSAWKGINFYAFQRDIIKPQFIALFAWLKDLQIPAISLSAQERNEFKATLEFVKTQLRNEWQKVELILRDYQDSYDKMFKLKTSSAEFVNFLKNSSRLYWELGNSLGKTGHASYCFDVIAKRFKGCRLPWEQTRDMIFLLAKIFPQEKKVATAMAW